MAKKNITEEEKQKYKVYFKDETDIFIIEKLAGDIIERCNTRSHRIKKKIRIMTA